MKLWPTPTPSFTNARCLQCHHGGSLWSPWSIFGTCQGQKSRAFPSSTTCRRISWSKPSVSLQYTSITTWLSPGLCCELSAVAVAVTSSAYHLWQASAVSNCDPSQWLQNESLHVHTSQPLSQDTIFRISSEPQLGRCYSHYKRRGES